MWDHLGALLMGLRPLDWLLVALLTFIGVLVHRAHRGPSAFNIEHLISDPVTGNVKLEKFALLVALVISTWGFIVLVSRDKLSEWYFIGYMAAWAVTRGLNTWITSKHKES